MDFDDELGPPGGRERRPLIAASWARSHASGVDPERVDHPVWADADLRAHRAAHPMSRVLPVVRTLLLDDLVDEGLAVALTDQTGRMLWIHADSALRRMCDGAGFVEGSDWSETRAGTNAPGLALAAAGPVQVRAGEHFVRPVRPLSCVAAPVRHPGTGQVLGTLDITGDTRAASRAMAALVRATVAAAEGELGLLLRDDPGALGQAERAPLHAQLLGPSRARIERGGAQLPLSPRHAEILALLADTPAGLTTGELGAELDDGGLDPVTVRAEISRLRKVLGPGALSSRPYRLAAGAGTDVDAVRACLATGDAVGVLAAYPGPLLPASFAPGVVRVRDELDAELGAAVLAGADPDLIARWAATPTGAQDRRVWAALAVLAEPGSVQQVRAAARRDLLDQRLGAVATPLQPHRL